MLGIKWSYRAYLIPYLRARLMVDSLSIRNTMYTNDYIESILALRRCGTEELGGLWTLARANTLNDELENWNVLSDGLN